MKILNIIGGKLSSGASKGAILHHEFLLKKGIDSYILTPEKYSNHNKKIFSMQENSLDSISIFLKRNLDKSIKFLFKKKFKTSFSNNIFGFNFTNHSLYKKSDIIHLHWVNDGLLSLSMLQKIDKPIFWTLRDMWAFTGGCHYSIDCKQFKKTCKRCPQLESSLNYDLSTFNQNNKISHYSKKIKFFSVSKWLSDQAKKSKVLKKYSVKNMNNHFDKKEFFFDNKLKYFNKFKIDKKKVILFLASNIEAKYKGLENFIKSTKYLNNKDYIIFFVGNFNNFRDVQDSLARINYVNFGFIRDKKLLRKIYSKSNCLVMCGMQDAMPKSFFESMMCGTPVLGMKSLSIADFIINKKNGYIVDKNTPLEIAKGIKFLCSLKKDEKQIEFCRKSILKQTDPSEVTKNYIKEYKKELKLI